MQIIVIMLLFILGNLIFAGSLVYIPSWFVSIISSWTLWLIACCFIIFLGWCLGDD